MPDTLTLSYEYTVVTSEFDGPTVSLSGQGSGKVGTAVSFAATAADVRRTDNDFLKALDSDAFAGLAATFGTRVASLGPPLTCRAESVFQATDSRDTPLAMLAVTHSLAVADAAEFAALLASLQALDTLVLTLPDLGP